jgi:hypothetical protein
MTFQVRNGTWVEVAGGRRAKPPATDERQKKKRYKEK